MKPFESPKRLLGNLDAEAAAKLIEAAADVALILDGEGIIQDLALGNKELSDEGYANWLGKRWSETVTVQSRSKVEALLRDAASKSAPRRRHINHPSTRGADVPVLYSALRIGNEGHIVALGRDLRAISMLQQRLVDAQQAMERDYWRLRQVETRYRLLFQTASEAVLIVDASSHKVVEANPVAGQFLGEDVKRCVGRSFPEGFDEESTRAIQELLSGVKAAGRADDVYAHRATGKPELLISASLFRQENAPFYLIRLSPISGDATENVMLRKHLKLLRVVERAPDAFVMTDPEGRILDANLAFMALTQLGAEEQARSQSLDRWLGRPGVDLNLLLATLRQHGSVRLFATTLRGEYGTSAEVEISAVSVPNGETTCLGFAIRDVGRRLNVDSRLGRELPRSVEQLTELVGRVSLKELVREATDLIERLCIEAALELTRDNRASAAEMLGLSRQSLYVKLHRYDLGDLGSETDH